MQTASADAYAKLTLTLHVVGTREDGFHFIESEMVSVDLADQLTFAEGDEVEMTGEFPVPVDRNCTVVQALAAVDRTAHVVVDKHIPPGGGLGGGSSDAATVLRWAGCLDEELAARIGADVAFCLRGGHAMVSGIGEVVEPLPFLDATFTLLTPPFAVFTYAVYREWDEMGGPTADTNDLELAAMKVEPRLAAWRDRLGDATGETPVLAGSGSSWWVPGAFPDVDAGDGVAHVVRTTPANY